MLHCRTFEEKKIRSRSADPSKRRKTDIFNTELTRSIADKPFASEYKNAFAWPKQSDGSGEENRQVKPIEKTHAAGLSSKQYGSSNKAHVIENSNGSRSIVIGVEPADCTDFAFTTGSATNLAKLVDTIPQHPFRPLTSMALVDSEMNKSVSSNGSNHTRVNKSVTITNLNDFVDKDETSSRKSTSRQKEAIQVKDTNNNQSQNGLDEKLLIEKLSKLNTYESIYGKRAGASTLFHKEEIITPNTLNKMPKKSEYKSKFKPFTSYVYVTGKGWFKPKKIKAKEDVQIKQIEEIATPISIKQQDASSVKSQETAVTSKTKLITSGDEKNEIASVKGAEEIDALIEEKGQPWYQEALERRLKANEFRYRSEYGNPILGRLGLEEVYKRASGDHWHASTDPKFEQLQQMRNSLSAFLPYDQHKRKLQEDKTDSKVKATPSKSPRTKRATSVPARKKSTTNVATAAKATQPSTQPAKVWIKPKAKETTTNGDAKETSANKVQRPPQNNLNKELKQAQQTAINGRASPPLLQSGPVRTTQIKSPEELSGIKSPPAANFLEQLDNEPINWTNSTTNPSLNSNAYSNLMNEFGPTSIRSDNLADLSGLKI